MPLTLAEGLTAGASVRCAQVLIVREGFKVRCCALRQPANFGARLTGPHFWFWLWFWFCMECCAETIGPVASYPTVDMSKLNNGEGTGSTSNSLKDQMLPDNGVLWNLDRIDQRKLPLNREYTCGSPALPALESATRASAMQCKLLSVCCS